jgi:hypothetical protein
MEFQAGIAKSALIQAALYHFESSRFLTHKQDPLTRCK